MNVANFVNFLVQALGVIAVRTETKLDDELQSFLKAVHESPALLAWIQSKVDAIGDDEDGTPPTGGTGGPFSMEALPSEVREKAELLGGIGTFAKYLPVLLELYRIWKSTQK